MGKSAMRKAKRRLEREQARRQRKNNPQSTNEVLGLRPITTANKKSFGENIGMYLREAWYFESAIEKLILVVLCALGLWKIAGWIF